jgi:hypothetical protein
MYSKSEMCFTLILTVAASLCFGSKLAAGQVDANRFTRTLADGGHPPPPPPTPVPPVQFTDAEALEADGGHPPPPTPWLSDYSQLS